MDRNFSKVALVVALSLVPLLAACSTSPETHLSWGVNDRLSPRRAPVRTAAATPANSGARTYVYQEPSSEAAPPVPTPMCLPSSLGSCAAMS